MKKLFIQIIFLYFVVSCKPDSEFPVWVNQQAILSLPSDTLIFKTKDRNWKVYLNSFLQPVPLHIEYTDSGFLARIKNSSGIIEGPGSLYITNTKVHRSYQLSIINDNPGNLILKDYRSPKTVNPDSSLEQQSITLTTDSWRNLHVPENSSELFSESRIQITPVAGTYRSADRTVLSGYYVQPGSCTSIPVTFSRNDVAETFEIVAGPLIDIYNNTLANGTAVVFNYTDGQYHFQTTASVINGKAFLSLPATKSYLLKAGIQNLWSVELKMNSK